MQAAKAPTTRRAIRSAAASAKEVRAANPWGMTVHERRRLLEQALEQLLEAAQGIVDRLDALDGDCEDEGGACEDEGWDSDSEPDQYHVVPHYADGGMDQTRIVGGYPGSYIAAR